MICCWVFLWLVVTCSCCLLSIYVRVFFKIKNKNRFFHGTMWFDDADLDLVFFLLLLIKNGDWK